jgi:hypothetical protein
MHNAPADASERLHAAAQLSKRQFANNLRLAFTALDVQVLNRVAEQRAHATRATGVMRQLHIYKFYSKFLPLC